MFGKEINKVKILNEHFNETGELTIFENGFIMKTDKLNVQGGFNYIKDMQSEGGLALGRIMVYFHVFDAMGDGYKLRIAMPEQSYLILKNKWEKALE